MRASFIPHQFRTRHEKSSVVAWFKALLFLFTYVPSKCQCHIHTHSHTANTSEHGTRCFIDSILMPGKLVKYTRKTEDDEESFWAIKSAATTFSLTLSSHHTRIPTQPHTHTHIRSPLVSRRAIHIAFRYTYDVAVTVGECPVESFRLDTRKWSKRLMKPIESILGGCSLISLRFFCYLFMLLLDRLRIHGGDRVGKVGGMVVNGNVFIGRLYWAAKINANVPKFCGK